MKKIFQIKGFVQNYSWGGKAFIPKLLGLQHVDNQTFAEVWLGAHHRGPAQIQLNGKHLNLNEWLEKNPQALGEEVIKKFGKRLPYLFKVLDVDKMLSIQAHPSKAAAIAGFAKENKAGISLTAPHRNYKDDNHKPEVMVALTDFYLLHGFKSEEEMEASLAVIPEFESLLKYFQRVREREVDHKIFHLYKNLMEMPQKHVDEILKPLSLRLKGDFLKNKLKKSNPDYWAALAFQDNPLKEGHFDRGIFSIYIFNLLKLEKGEGIFQASGVPHAYLEGANIELMANSDNVFRGGLTVKHVDVQELLENINFEPVTPQILKGKEIARGVRIYATPAPDFELTRIILKDFQSYRCISAITPETLIVIEGEIIVMNQEQEIRLRKGQAFFAPSGAAYTLVSDGTSTIFKAAVPV